MKIPTLLLSLFLTLGSFLNAQSPQESIRQGFDAYQKDLQAGNFEKSTEYIYPKLFKLLPKEKMIELMETMANNPMVQIKIGESKVIKVQEIEKIGAEYFSVISYQSKMQMKILAGKTPEQKEVFRKKALEGFNAQFGAENVSYAAETGFFSITAVKNAVAVSSNGESDWKYVALEDSQKVMAQEILPTAIIELAFP